MTSVLSNLFSPFHTIQPMYFESFLKQNCFDGKRIQNEGNDRLKIKHGMAQLLPKRRIERSIYMCVCVCVCDRHTTEQQSRSISVFIYTLSTLFSKLVFTHVLGGKPEYMFPTWSPDVDLLQSRIGMCRKFSSILFHRGVDTVDQ
jgi:hypothetical protein